MQNLGPAYNRGAVTKNIMYWWLGQVVDESAWIGNEVRPNHERDDSEGWGKRYRVRIFSRDSEVKVIPDQMLDMAEVIAPVTSGSGHGGYGETVVLAQGSYVMGFYLDGEEGRQPIIFGTLPNNAQTRLLGSDPEQGFIPRSGFRGLTGNKQVATKDLHMQPGSIAEKESTTSDGSVNDVRNTDQIKDGQEVAVRKKNIECEGGGGPMKGVQGFIQKALAIIQRIKDAGNSFYGAVSDAVGNIQSIVQSVASGVASLFKLIVGKMRGFVLNKLNLAIKDAAQLLPPTLRQVFATGSTQGLDTMSCVFQKIMGGLFNMAKGLFEQIVDQYISAPMCAAERMIGDMIGNILGEITGAINGVLGAISGIVGAAGDIMGQAFSVLDTIAGLLNFLKCDETPNCNYPDRWSFWDGSSLAQEVSQGVGSFLADVNGIGGDAASYSSCNTDQLPCGPPQLSFSGGGGSGLSASAIIGAAGQIMGVDFGSFGGGYTSTPLLSISNACGGPSMGGGANIQLLSFDASDPNDTPSTVPKRGDDIRITGAVVRDPGSGYLQTPDGSTSVRPGDPNITIIRDNDGNISVYDPGETITLPSNIDEESNPEAFLPSGSTVPIYDSNGDQIDTIRGEGLTVGIPIRFPTDVTFTTPEDSDTGTDGDDTGTDGEDIGGGSTVNGEERDIILDGVIINDGGANYQQGDTIVIEPNDGGAIIDPIFNEIGTLIDVNIREPGQTFNRFPRIRLQSNFGVNADILPIFKVRTDEDPDANAKKLQGDKIISVDQCIGRLVIGYVNGQPYYGTYHKYQGKKVVGRKGSTTKRQYIYDTPEESLGMNDG